MEKQVISLNVEFSSSKSSVEHDLHGGINNILTFLPEIASLQITFVSYIQVSTWLL